MSEEKLLAVLCDWLCEYRSRIMREISSLKKKHNIEPSSLNLRNQIAEKERELALITEEKIKKYRIYFKFHGKSQINSALAALVE